MFKSIISLHVDSFSSHSSLLFKALRMSAWFLSCFSSDWTAACVTVVCIVEIKKYRATSLQIIVYKTRLQRNRERERNTSLRKRRWRRVSSFGRWHFLQTYGKTSGARILQIHRGIINYELLLHISLYNIIIFPVPSHINK